MQDILDQLPGSERECIRQELGDAAYDEFLQVSFATLPSPDQAEAFFTCIGQESATRLYVASAAGVSGLSDETYTCMLGVLAEYDLHDVLSGAIQQEFTMVMGTILCLNAEEAVQAGVSSLPAATTSGQASLVQMQCVASQVGVANMIGVLIQAPGTVDLPEALFTTVSECGIELLRPDRGTGFSLTGEQFQCLTAALDPTTLIELQSGVRFPNADELAIIQACGVDLTGS